VHLPHLVDGAVPSDMALGTAEGLAEERRLFYVAVTRARRRLVVTAVEGALDGADAGVTASRFLDLVAPPPEEGRPLTELPRSLTLPALVAALRRAVVDPKTTPARRAAAASLLRRLADEQVPGAGPSAWWGLAPLSDDAPLVGPDEPVRVRPSAIEGFRRCPLRWVLGAVGAEAAPDTSRTVGSAVHAVAQRVAEGLPPAEATAALDAELDTLDLGPGWADQRQRAGAHEMLERFLAWHGANRRELLAAEADFDVSLGRVRIRGQVDRLERDGEGRLVVVDLKTGKTAAKNEDIGEHGQLAAYQVAVASGAFGDHGSTSGGAALLQVGSGAKAKEQHQEPLPAGAEPEDTWAGQLIAEVGEGMGAATFEVRTGSYCERCPSRRSCPLHERGGQVTQ
jgi:RecB family exonuclease